MKLPGLRILTVPLLALGATVLLADPAVATYKGQNGRIAWAVYNAGGGGGGGYASLTTYNSHGGARRQLGYCAADSNGACSSWENVVYSPHGRQLLWDQPGSSGQRVIMLAGSDASSPTVVDHDMADETQASFSPNGRKIVYIRQPSGVGGEFGTIVTSDLSGGSVNVVSPSIQASAPLFTPDGRHIVFVREDAFSSAGGLWSISPTGHGLRRLLGHAWAFDVSPKGRQIAYVAKGGDLFVARADGSHSHRVARQPDGTDPIEAVRFSPNGELLVYAGQSAGTFAGDSLFTVSAGGGRSREIAGSGDSRTVTSGLAWQAG